MNLLDRERTLNFIFYFCSIKPSKNALLITDHTTRLGIDLSLFHVDMHYCLPENLEDKVTFDKNSKVKFFGSSGFPSFSQKYQLIIIDLQKTSYKKLLSEIITNLESNGNIVILDWSKKLKTTLSKLFWHFGFTKKRLSSITDDQLFNFNGLPIKLEWYFFVEPNLLKPRRLVRRAFKSEIPDETKSVFKRVLNKLGLFYLRRHHRIIIGKQKTAKSESGFLEQLITHLAKQQINKKSLPLSRTKIKQFIISGTKILILDVIIGQSKYIIRLPLDHTSIKGIHKEVDILNYLNSNNIHLVPKAISYKRDDPFTYYVEEKIGHGERIELLIKKKNGVIPLYTEMLQGILKIHIQLGENITMDDSQFERYVFPSINTILENTKTDSESTQVFDKIKTEMKLKLNDKIVMRSICHGDLKIENGIFDSQGKLKGIIDWDKSEIEGVTITDIACLLATSIRLQYFSDSSLVDFMKRFETVPEEFIPLYKHYFKATQTSYINPKFAILYYWVDRLHKLLTYQHSSNDIEWMKENINPVFDRINYFIE